MKRLLALLTAMLLLSWPMVSHAQYNDDTDEPNPTAYNDTDDGQFLKVVSYILTPFGMALEWGVTRPLHSLSTKTTWLSGDTNNEFFDENNNAVQTPPGTFGPYTINPTNAVVSNNQVVAPVPVERIPIAPIETTTRPVVTNIPPSAPPPSETQPAIQP